MVPRHANAEDELKVPDLSVDQVGYLNLTTHSANFLADPIDLKVRKTLAGAS